MALGIVQIPVVLVTLPAIIYAFAVKSTTMAIIFTVWFIIAGLSDAVLKPMMIGHGSASRGHPGLRPEIRH